MTEEAEVNDAPEPTEPEETEVSEVVGEEQQPESSPEQEQEKSKKDDSVQKRFNELTKARRQEERARRAAERNSEYWRQQAMEKKPEPAKPEPVKTLADFDYDESAYQQHLFSKAREEAVIEAKRVLAEEQSQQTEQQKRASFAEKMAVFAETVDDFDQVARNHYLPINEVMEKVLLEMDNGPEVLYHLGKNEDLADKISQLSPLQVARELGRIEVKLQSQVKEGEKVSKAPVPTPKIAAADPAVKKDWDEISQSEFNERRRKYIANNRGR